MGEEFDARCGQHFFKAYFDEEDARSSDASHTRCDLASNSLYLIKNKLIVYNSWSQNVCKIVLSFFKPFIT